jgi:hypothetical protein
MSEPNEDLVREVYARFGLAYYHSECLHRELGNTFTFLTFLEPSHLTTHRAEEKMAYAYSLTLGKLVDELKELLPEDLYKRLDFAVEKRNFLAHHFWYERIYKMHSEDGALDLIDELEGLANLFNELDEEVQNCFSGRWKEFGITPDLIKNTLAQMIASGEPVPALPHSRRFQKVEEVMKAWNVPISKDGFTTLVFQTVDGCLWQLCDVGLGWTRFNQVDSDWMVNEQLQKLLPVKINPRPKNSQPWNYEFDFGNGRFMWVKKNDSDLSFKWGVRITKVK